MNGLEKMVLDQEIIVKALYILGEVITKPSDFITKEMLDRLPELKKQEQMKLVMLEKGAKK
jgi:hypothetical protein